MEKREEVRKTLLSLIDEAETERDRWMDECQRRDRTIQELRHTIEVMKNHEAAQG